MRKPITVLLFIIFITTIPFMFPRNFVYKNIFLHAFIEILSGVLSILFGSFIAIHYKKYAKLWLLDVTSVPFIALGISEILHAFTTNVQFFVWTRVLGNSLNILLIFLYMIAYKFLNATLIQKLPIKLSVILISVISLATSPIFLPHPLETYVEDIDIIRNGVDFSIYTKIINTFNGVIYYAISLFLIQDYLRNREYLYTPFIISFFLFASSCFLFPESKLWNLQWWYWHIIRLLVHIIILIFAFRFYNLIVDKVIEQKTMLIEIQEKLLNMHKYGITESLNALYSHNIKNKLSILKNYIEILKNFYIFDKEALELVNLIEIELNEIHKTLIDSRPKINSTYENLYDLISNIVKELKIITIDKAIHLNWFIDKQLDKVIVPRFLIETALWNIIINSLEALANTEKPNRIIKLFGEISGQTKEAIIIVEDNAEGLPIIIKEEIFKPFQTLKSGGWGLGLSFAKFAATALGGSLDIIGEEGKGTRVILKLPA